MSDVLRVYIAAPYTTGDVAENVHIAVLAGLEIFAAGHMPFIPHLYHFIQYLSPQPLATWVRFDLHWLKLCDRVVRLPGESPGADREVEFAKVLGLPIYYSLPACLLALPPKKGVAL